MKNNMRKVSVATVALVSVGLLAGCGGSVPKEDVESQVSSAITKSGAKADKVDCPKDLKGKVDEEMTCKVTMNGKDIDMKVKVTKVEDGKAYFDVQPAS